MLTHDVEIIKSKRLTNNRPFNDFLFLFILISETSLFLINSPVDHIDDGTSQQVSDLTRWGCGKFPAKHKRIYLLRLFDNYFHLLQIIMVGG